MELKFGLMDCLKRLPVIDLSHLTLGLLDPLPSLPYLTLLVNSALLDSPVRDVRFANFPSNQFRGPCTHGANKVGQGAVAGLFSSQMKYSLASLLSGSPKLEMSGECGSG